ncbi:MAG: alanine racemase [Phycisphaerales bacterium]
MSTSRIDIDLSAIGNNIRAVRRVLSGELASREHPEAQRDPASSERPRVTKAPAICAVLKQDAYGMGAVRIAKRLAACGVDMIAVFSVDEARSLVEAGIAAPMLVLMPVRNIDRSDPVYRHAVVGKLHLTIHDEDQLAAITEVCGRLGAAMPLHVQIDTGLARGGALPAVGERIVESIARNPRLRLGGLMTHFATPCGDPEFTREQARLFREWVEKIKPMLVAGAGHRIDASTPHGLLIHAANSCAVFRSSKYHGNLVRIGQCLYGYALEGASDREGAEFAAAAASLQPATRWTSSVVHIKDVPTGFPVGYGSTWRAARPTRIALVPIGYADGYPRLLSNAAVVGFTGNAWERSGATLPPGADTASAGSPTGRASNPAPTMYAPVIGRVSMDQITIDVSDVPISMCKVGSEVEIAVGERAAPNSFLRLAELSQSIVHEQMCRVGPRVERSYRLSASGTQPRIHVFPESPASGASFGGDRGSALACDYRADAV